MDSREKLLELKNVDVTFGKGKKAVQAVKDASFSIYKGEVFSLVGESGSGKTTIGRAVMGIHPIAGGQILFKGKSIAGKRLARQIQMVFQDPASSLNDRATVAEIIGEAYAAQLPYEITINFVDESGKVLNTKKASVDVG